MFDEYVDTREDDKGSKLWLAIALAITEVPVPVDARDGVLFDKGKRVSWWFLSKSESFSEWLGKEAARCRPVKDNLF